MRDDRPVPFLIHRLFRILPLAWLAMALLALANRAEPWTIAANFLFFANLPPAHLMHGGEPLWSLCVEVQFYAGIALIVALWGRRGLNIVPFAALAVTAWRIGETVPISIVTWERIDEILAGSTLALFMSWLSRRERPLRPPAWATVVLVALLVTSAHPSLPAMPYFRPYFAAAAVGTSMLALPRWMASILRSRLARYIAEISYALYVFHGMLAETWLGAIHESKVQRYLRLPLLLAVTFALAHLSTFFYERRWISLGKRLAARGARSGGRIHSDETAAI